MVYSFLLVSGQSSDIFTIPTFGQKAIGLGRLYSAYDQKFLPASSLWKPEVIKSYVDVINHPKEETFWTGSQSEEEKYNLIDIDVTGSVGIALPDIVGKVKATGSLNYLEENKVNIIKKYYV